MAQYSREERQIRDENQRLQQRLQQEIEKNAKLLQFLPENDSFSGGGNDGNFSLDNISIRGGSRDRSPINISPVPLSKSSAASFCDSQKDEADRSYISSEDDNSCTSFSSSTRCASCGVPTEVSVKTAFTSNTESAKIDQ
uniref:Uncharacterized protein n=1 Tax=Romanomermis culicivorax TaxID=13658 RepID=A0A915I9V7_ROMCU